MQLLTLFDRTKRVYLKMAHLFIKHYQQQSRIMLSFSNCLANYPTLKRTVKRLSSFYLLSETRWIALSFTGQPFPLQVFKHTVKHGLRKLSLVTVTSRHDQPVSEIVGKFDMRFQHTTVHHYSCKYSSSSSSSMHAPPAISHQYVSKYNKDNCFETAASEPRPTVSMPYTTGGTSFVVEVIMMRLTMIYRRQNSFVTARLQIFTIKTIPTRNCVVH